MANEGNILTFNPQPHNEVEMRQALQRIYTLVPPSTHNATRMPTNADDSTKGWRLGSVWIDSSTNIRYVCTNNAEAGAVWQQMLGTHDKTGGVAGVADLDGTVDYVGVFDQSAGIIVRTTLEVLVQAVLGNHHHVSAGTGGVIPDFTAIKTVTTTYTITATDTTILCDATGGAFTVTLPAAATHEGYTFRIKKIDSSANAVTVAAA